ncbi:MAG TPA: PQQ-binding-like beta-propeller repeat protein [Gemmataceae bacterium]|nr:PQQ-binding-like beta-propeller repeat protein [Gemmataceae bacterium]
MSRSKRCPWVVGLGIGLLIGAGGGSCRAQEKGPGNLSPPVSVPTSAVLARRLEAARDYIQAGSWAEAARALQALLDLEEDVLVPVRRPETGDILWRGIRTEAERILSGLPAPGRDVYETIYGPQAQALLAAARRKGDMGLLDEVARCYFPTAAGGEATRQLGLHYLDRGRFDLAALYFARLLDRADTRRLPPAALLASALAFRLAGDESRAARAWHRLAVRAPLGVRLGDQFVSLEELEKELARLQAAAPGSSSRPGWALFRGSASRSGEGAGTVVQLEARWTEPTIREALTRHWVEIAVQQEGQSRPVLPASFPIVVGGKVIYRSYRGIHAVEGRTGKLEWESALEWTFDRLARELRYQPYLDSWVAGYLQNNPQVLFENSILGTLSSDGVRVYAVEDLAVPPYPFRYPPTGRRWGPVAEPFYGPELTDAARHNRLLALDVASGKLLWQAPSPLPLSLSEKGEQSVPLSPSEKGEQSVPLSPSKGERVRVRGGSRSNGSPLHDSFFLGPPLPHGGRLYGVLEKDQELHLVCLDAARGDLLWTQTLVVPMNRLQLDVGRRIQALHLACADGILVCPTNAGVILGVDLCRRSLAWAYFYREEEPLPPEGAIGGRWGRSVPRVLPRLRADWKSAGPVLVGDKVIVTAPDSGSLHCLDLQSGALVWKAERTEDDLYLAGVHAGKAVVVGKHGCRALALADGKQVWSVEVGLPSGQGMIVEGVYYLPLKAALPEKRPAICAIDLERGAVVRRIMSPRGEVPGNLVFCEDGVFSQTVDAVTAYPPKGDTDRED